MLHGHELKSVLSSLTFSVSVVFFNAELAASLASLAISLFCSVFFFKASIWFSRSSRLGSINFDSMLSSLSFI